MEKKTHLVCETCGANLKISEGGGRAVCPYCGKIYDLGQKTEKGKGIYAVLSSLQQRVGIVASNYGFAEGRAASDSFESDGAEEERALLAGATVRDGVLVRYRARNSGEAARVPDEVKIVAKKAAYKDALVGRVSFAPEVATIGKKAFSCCQQLVRVRLEGVNMLCSKAFANCAALREVTIARFIPKVGRKVFAGCKKLTRVILPRSMEGQISRLFGRFAKIRIEFVYID